MPIQQPGDDWMPDNVKQYIQEQIRIVREAEMAEAAERKEKQSRFYVHYTPGLGRLESVPTIKFNPEDEIIEDDRDDTELIDQPVCGDLKL